MQQKQQRLRHVSDTVYKYTFYIYILKKITKLGWTRGKGLILSVPTDVYTTTQGNQMCM